MLTIHFIYERFNDISSTVLQDWTDEEVVSTDFVTCKVDVWQMRTWQWY
jgi:hypothetical protein